jgi:hypothetical protein
MEIDMNTTTVRPSGRLDNAPQLSVARMNLMRAGYLLMGVGLALVKWPLLLFESAWKLLWLGLVSLPQAVTGPMDADITRTFSAALSWSSSSRSSRGGTRGAATYVPTQTPGGDPWWCRAASAGSWSR